MQASANGGGLTRTPNGGTTCRVSLRWRSASSSDPQIRCRNVVRLMHAMVAMASTAPVSGRCRLPVPFTDCSPSRTGPLSRQQGVAACRQPQRTVTCSAQESGHQHSVSEILRSAAVGLAAAAAVALPMTLLPDQVPVPPARPQHEVSISCAVWTGHSLIACLLTRARTLTAADQRCSSWRRRKPVSCHASR